MRIRSIAGRDFGHVYDVPREMISSVAIARINGKTAVVVIDEDAVGKLEAATMGLRETAARVTRPLFRMLGSRI